MIQVSSNFPLVSSMARMTLSGTRATVRWREGRGHPKLGEQGLHQVPVELQEAAELGPKMHRQLDFLRHPPGETFGK